MSIAVKLSPELRHWMLHNLDRGCAPADLIRSMVGEKFDLHIARGLVEVFVQARAHSVEPPEDTVNLDVAPPEYCYETPRLSPGNLLCAEDRNISVLMRFERPAIAVLGDVMSAEECAQVIELARSRLKPSTVVDPMSGLNRVAEYRNSDGMFFRPQESPFIAKLEKRIAAIMNAPIEHGEGLQVLRYGPGTQSTPHFDFLIPSNAANQASLARSGQRIASLVVYLNNVGAGGGTDFPEVGLSVSPRKGNAVYFEYCNSRHQVDYKSLHAGAPVIEGEKWALTKWVRERRFVSG